MHRVISAEAALLALALLNYADDEGRFEADVDQLKALLFTCRTLTKPIPELLEELAQPKVDWLTLYPSTINGEEVTIGQVVNFKRHQVISRPKKSSFPGPKKVSITDSSMINHGSIMESSQQDEMINHGGVILPCTGEGRKERNEGRKECTPSRSDDAVAFEPPTLEQIRDYGAKHDIPAECCEKFFWNGDRDGWLDERQRPMVRWASSLHGYAVSWKANLKNAGVGTSGGVKSSEKNAAALSRLEAQVDAEEDPEKRRALRERIRELGGVA